LKLAMVNGPTSEISSVTVSPIVAAVSSRGRALFRSSTQQQITSTSIPVAITSVPNAAGADVRYLASGVSGWPPGFGKYSPNTIALASLPACPRTIPLARSNSRSASPKEGGKQGLGIAATQFGKAREALQAGQTEHRGGGRGAELDGFAGELAAKAESETWTRGRTHVLGGAGKCFRSASAKNGNNCAGGSGNLSSALNSCTRIGISPAKCARRSVLANFGRLL
jgi:hypothetical protein